MYIAWQSVAQLSLYMYIAWKSVAQLSLYMYIAWQSVAQFSLYMYMYIAWQSKYIELFYVGKIHTPIWSTFGQYFFYFYILFLNSLMSVRVFTRIISDNPWCSLLAICTLRSTYNVTFTHCITSYSQPKWMTRTRFFLNWLWNLINFKKHFKLTFSGGIFTGIVRTFCTVYKAWRWRSQVFTSWCGKIQTDF